jgi:phosphatidylethanolamine-binding protein (PEBP) family uncharacterized protein
MQLTSEVLGEARPIPLRYTKDGENLSPPLRWSGVPDDTRELVLLCENITPQTQEPFVHDGPLGSIGKTVRYRFRLLAVDRELGLEPGADERGVSAALAGHVLDEAALTVVDERQP